MRVGRLKDAVPPLLIAAALALVPFSTCSMKWALHVPCPLCGMTRASLVLLRGDVARATALHPLVLPLAALSATTVGVALLAHDDAWRVFVRRALLVALTALMVVWVARFFGAFGGPVG